MRDSQERERHLRSEMKERLAREEVEKSELISQIRRTQDSMDELSGRHKELLDDVVSRDSEVSKLEVSPLHLCPVP